MSFFTRTVDAFVRFERERSTKKPLLLKTRSSKVFALATVAFGIYADVFLTGAAVRTAPIGLGQWEATPEFMSWSLFTYGMSSLISSPIAGLVADVSKTRRTPLLVGSAFSLAAIACLWSAHSIPTLLFGRMLQGVAASYVWTVGAALIVDVSAMRGQRGFCLAHIYIALCWGLVIAPNLAGVDMVIKRKEHIYGAALGLALWNGLFRFFLIEPHVSRKWTEATSGIEMTGPSDPPRYQEYGATPSVLAYIQTVLQSWRLLATLFGTWAWAHIAISMAIAIPIYFGDEYDWSDRKVGFMRLAFYSTSFLSVFSGYLADVYGAILPAVFGFVCGIALISGLAVIELLTTIDIPSVVWAAMVFTGVALGIAAAAVTSEIANYLDDKQKNHAWLRHYFGGHGLAYGAFTAFVSIGYMSASLLTPLVLEENGWVSLMFSLAVICLFGAVPMALGPRRERPSGKLNLTVLRGRADEDGGRSAA